jgi:tryptophan synthase alpha chain|tara:strand:+ start:44 stop:853 length:810 start_codon:yes stop_codon:yes gene_type:complete
MKTYNQVFSKLKRKKERALVAFTVIGDPNYKTSLEIVKKIIDSGADILELGLPFSDPIADGPTIQAADNRALKNKFNTDKAFQFIKSIREYNNEIPIGLLVYGNLVFQRGIKKFYSDTSKAGINSVLIADVPPEEADEYAKAARKHKIDTVFIVSPLTSNERLKKIDKKIRGFVYVVSRLGVTGAKASLKESTLDLVRRVRKFTKKPLCVGFGISKPEHVKSVIKAGADGAIVGSAIVDLIEKNINNKKRMLDKIGNYVKNMKNATKIM